MITGLADALLDSVPVVAITGQVGSALIGTDAFQEIDVLGLSLACTKHSFLVESLDALPGIMAEAFAIACSGRPGPVLIDIPKDIQLAHLVPVVEELHYPAAEVAQAAELLAQAHKPMLYIGGGVGMAQAVPALREFIAVTQMPNVVTLKGLGAADAAHPYYLGMLGMHGTKGANLAVQECDLLIAVGARFDDRVTGKLNAFAPHAKVIHMDIDPAEMSKLRQAHVALEGDLKALLPALQQPLKIAAWQQRVIEASGGVAKEFNTIAVDDGIAMGHGGMLYSLPSRELIADSVEYMVNAHCADAMVCISNCDKITPGMLMASLRLNIPVIFVSGGPMEAALGLSQPGNGSLLATHADRKDLFLNAGKRIVALTKRYYEQDDESALPRSIANKAAFENAMTLDIAMGGSTNTVLHLLAAAQEGEIDFTMEDIDRLSRKVPHLCKVAPSTPKYHMEDVHRAGGVLAILGELDRAGLLNRDTLERYDIMLTKDEAVKKMFRAGPAGIRTTQAFSQDCRWDTLDDDRAEGCIRSLENAFSQDGGLAVLYGNMAQ
ncbi:hypothetical protein J437_LFUL019679, partial [Ladona fulva]